MEGGSCLKYGKNKRRKYRWTLLQKSCQNCNVARSSRIYMLDKAVKICKYFLVKFCPNELFVNTKADLGPCTKIHDERLKKDFETMNPHQRLILEDDFLRFCQGKLADVEKRIRRAKQRLALGSHEDSLQGVAGSKNDNEKVVLLSDKINDLLSQVEQLGCEGKVEEAQGIMKLCDQLKEEKEELCRTLEPNNWLQQTAEIAAAQEKQMEVCDVCGAFLIVGDAQQRIDDHLSGKQHVGYARLKAAVEEITLRREKEREERGKMRERDREERGGHYREDVDVREERKYSKEEHRPSEPRSSRHSGRSGRRSRSRSVERNHQNRNWERSQHSYGYSKHKDRERYQQQQHRDYRSSSSKVYSHDSKHSHHSRKRSSESRRDSRRGDRKDKKRKYDSDKESSDGNSSCEDRKPPKRVEDENGKELNRNSD